MVKRVQNSIVDRSTARNFTVHIFSMQSKTELQFAVAKNILINITLFFLLTSTPKTAQTKVLYFSF